MQVIIALWCEVASFPGLSTVQFLIACSMQKLEGGNWEALHGNEARSENHQAQIVSVVASASYLTGTLLTFVKLTGVGITRGKHQGI